VTGWNSKRALPKDWGARKLRVWREKGRVCALQYDGCEGYATEVDHIDGNEDHRIVNLQPVCSRCHDVKTKRQSKVAARKKADLLHPREEKHPGML
jgi:5-methylcytosine-specific restriction protein A